MQFPTMIHIICLGVIMKKTAIILFVIFTLGMLASGASAQSPVGCLVISGACVEPVNTCPRLAVCDPVPTPDPVGNKVTGAPLGNGTEFNQYNQNTNQMFDMLNNIMHQYQNTNNAIINQIGR